MAILKQTNTYDEGVKSAYKPVTPIVPTATGGGGTTTGTSGAGRQTVKTPAVRTGGGGSSAVASSGAGRETVVTGGGGVAGTSGAGRQTLSTPSLADQLASFENAQATQPTTPTLGATNPTSTGTGTRSVSRGTTIDLGSVSDDLFTGILDSVGFDYNYMSIDQARDLAMGMLGKLDLSGYDSLRQIIMASGKDNKDEILRQYDMLVSQLAKQRTENKEEFQKTRGVISENAYDRGRQMLNLLASRGLAGSGLQQLGEIQNRMETGDQISDVANRYYDADEEIATQGVNAQGQMQHQLNSLANNMNAQLANVENSRMQYSSQYQANLANLANQILQNDMAKGNMLYDQYNQDRNFTQNASQFDRSLAEQQRQFDSTQALNQAQLAYQKSRDSQATNSLQGDVQRLLATEGYSDYQIGAELMAVDPKQFPNMQSALSAIAGSRKEQEGYYSQQALTALPKRFVGDRTEDMSTLTQYVREGILTSPEQVKQIAPKFYEKYANTTDFKKLFGVSTSNWNQETFSNMQNQISALSQGKGWAK